MIKSEKHILIISHYVSHFLCNSLYIYIPFHPFISSIVAHMICCAHIIHAVIISLSLSKATLRELSRVTSGREEESRVQ